MLAKRYQPDQDDLHPNPNPGPVAEAETVRSASHPPLPPRDEEKISVFWRVFGGTILSIVALVAITLYNNIHGTISELRAEVIRGREALAGVAKREDLDREREARSALARKDDVDTRVKALYERLRAVEGFKVDIERVTVLATAASATADSLKKDSAVVEVLRERVGVLAAELKQAAELAQRVQAEVERNKSGDIERKTARDNQAKAFEESLRELQRAVQDCREKLARLEGTTRPAAPAPKSDGN